MSERPASPQNAPYAVELEEGKDYYWCACGRSQNQPYCDGAHQGTSFQPVAFKAEKTGTTYRCGCKKTSAQPNCDGTHRQG